MDDKSTETATWSAVALAIAGLFGRAASRWMKERAAAAARKSGADSEVRRSIEVMMRETRLEIERMHVERRRDREEIDELRRENTQLRRDLAHVRAELETVQSRLEDARYRNDPESPSW